MSDLSNFQLVPLLLFILSTWLFQTTNHFDFLPFPSKPPKYQLSFKIGPSSEPGILAPAEFKLWSQTKLWAIINDFPHPEKDKIKIIEEL